MAEHRADDPVDRPRAERRSRRVRTDAPPGSDPNPVAEPPRHRADENDEQLRRDVPPHWGARP
ncbi:hypothetical protein [Antiquaquibacter soli]|uniref:Uncharacterized protein n=1 Tax=Antiquaquibacter soli TaxID=3064523 RepID=A0ABT9BVZ8_9MICO|nr:hypothetical protein [Protaetiibacter sp. WY-16]MDO7883482.1 hypothetical protein [Protaetiibacter sp. WY-16]